jgi:putative flavoprotein involved in K+ transport
MFIDTVVIGAGHAGLAVSATLTARGIEHLVLERGQPAQRWRSARWDSFRLLTPAWLTRLPGWSYRGPDPDAYLSTPKLVDYLEEYARSFAAPVRPDTNVLRVEAVGGRYDIHTTRGYWSAANVVVATGYHTEARAPAVAAGLPPELTQVTPVSYRDPDQIPGGAVLVVGASASGVQVADELARAGRPVLLSVGRHTRLPRRYQGRDIYWWLERRGSLDRRPDDLPEAVRLRGEPSPQLSGTGRCVDLGALVGLGVRLAGRLTTVDRGRLWFADDLAATTTAADSRMRRILSTVDDNDGVAPVIVPGGLRSWPLDRISAVVWATGFRPSYPWLRVPVLDQTGRIRHRRGVTAARGLYAIGLPFQSRRSSTLIDGARFDAEYVTTHLAARRAGIRRSA